MNKLASIKAPKAIDTKLPHYESLVHMFQATIEQRLVETLNEKASEFKTLCEQAGVKAKSYFVEKNEVPVVVYANPANPEQTYSKGPRPEWLKAILDGITDKKAVKAKMAELIVG